MSKYIKDIIKNIIFSKELPKPMGRWRTENRLTQMNHKIDLSNEDHCGPCGQYALSKIGVKKENRIDKQKIDKHKSEKENYKKDIDVPFL
jgi:hypothetical protein